MQKITKFLLSAPVVLVVGGGLSYLFVYYTCLAASGFPLTVFTVLCTIIVAAIAFPQIAIGFSSSHIAKELVPVFYKSYQHWLFLLYQALIALYSLWIAHVLPAVEGSTLLSDILLFLIVFDFFCGVIYFRYIMRLIESPKDMLDRYLKRIKRILCRKPGKGKDDLITEINNIGRIGRYTTMSSEKAMILGALEILEKIVTCENVPKTLMHVKNAGVEPHVDAPCKKTLTKSQFEAWESLVKSITQTCTITNELHSASKDNTRKALSMLHESWKRITRFASGGFGYEACTNAISGIAYYAIQKGFDDCVAKAAEILDKITQSSLKKLLEEKDYSKLFVSPFITALVITQIGIAMVKAGKDEFLSQYIGYLIQYFIQSQETAMPFLFRALDLMAFTYEKNNDSLEGLQNPFYEISDAQLKAALDYGAQKFQRETARIKRFLESLGKLNGQDKGTLSILKKVFGPIWDRIKKDQL